MAVNRKKGLAALEKVLKDGQMTSLADQKPLEVVPTGIATLDSALGVGGFVRGSMVVVYGQASAGKSAAAYTAIGNLMKSDPDAMACIFDVERSATKEWCEKFGIDPERVRIVQEPTIEDTVNDLQQVMRSNVFDYILIDSLGAVMRAVAFDGKDGKGGDENKAVVAGSAATITHLVNKVNGEFTVLDKMENTGHEVLKPVVLMINQVRVNMNSMYGGVDMPGGYALKHMMDVRLRVSASGAPADKMMGTVNGEKVQVGTRVNVTVEKNKFAPPLRQAGYNFCFEECPEWQFGIDSVAACFDLAVKHGVIATKGAWCRYGEEGDPGYVKANGKNAMMELLRDNPEFYDAVYADVMAAVGKDNEGYVDEADEIAGKVDEYVG